MENVTEQWCSTSWSHRPGEWHRVDPWARSDSVHWDQGCAIPLCLDQFWGSALPLPSPMHHLCSALHTRIRAPCLLCPVPHARIRALCCLLLAPCVRTGALHFPHPCPHAGIRTLGPCMPKLGPKAPHPLGLASHAVMRPHAALSTLFSAQDYDPQGFPHTREEPCWLDLACRPGHVAPLWYNRDVRCYVCGGTKLVLGK